MDDFTLGVIVGGVAAAIASPTILIFSTALWSHFRTKKQIQKSLMRPDPTIVIDEKAAKDVEEAEKLIQEYKSK